MSLLVFRPAIWLLNGLAMIILKPFGIDTSAGHESLHSNEELQYLLDQGKESGALDTNEHELIKNVFPALFGEDVDKIIERGSETDLEGNLTSYFAYLQDYLDNQN